MNQLLQKATNALALLRYGKVIRPHRDWLLVLVVTLLLLIGSGVFNAWLFSKVVRGEFLGDAVEAPVAATLDTLEEVEEVLEERRAKEMQYRTEASFIDPAPVSE